MNGNQESFEEKITSLNNTADTTAEFDQQDINNNKVMAILAYFGILVLVPILVLLILAIIGVINAANGKAKQLPVIGNIKLLKV